MSIIEKAVNKVNKPGSSDEVESRAPGQKSCEYTAGTVQKSVIGLAAEEQPARAVGRPEAHQNAGIINLPFDHMHSIGMLTPAVPRSSIAEEYRTIKRPLLTNIEGHSAAPIKNANLIMVTSALQGDGKTFSAINLAMSIAMEQDKTVLLVDADIAKAEAGRLLGVPDNSPGLIDILENKGVYMGDVILQTNVEKLRILPAGNLHAHANELLASGGMRHLMLELSERYADRVIIFDSSPLLLTTEASVLANFVGQIVFVVSAEVTPQHAVTEALEHIGQDKMVGMVLNRARSRGGRYGYGYGYGRNYYGYGSRVRDSAPEE